MRLDQEKALPPRPASLANVREREAWPNAAGLTPSAARRASTSTAAGRCRKTAALQASNPLPIPAPPSAAAWLADRRVLLDRRLVEVGRKATLHALEDVLLADGRMRISPLKAATPVDAKAALAPLYACLPLIRITDLLSEVDRWTGLTAAFTHLHSGQAAEAPRVTLAAALADATNLGHRRMAEACALVSQRQLA